VLKHCVYIWHGCGMHSKRVWSLNHDHDITTSLGLGLSSIFLKSTPDLHRCNSVSVYIWHGCGMHSKRVWSLNHDITTSLGLGRNSIVQKNTLDLHRRNSIRVHPYAHPQHIKVLKHCIHMTWMWDSLQAGLEPQPWHYNITWAWAQLNFPKIHPWPAQV
jgi:hypothetical protein